MVSARTPESKTPPDASRGKRRYVPRFGVRSLLIFALLFCVFFAWVGRGYYRVRQEDAAIETILRSGGSIYTEAHGGIDGPPGALSESSDLPIFERAGDVFFRSVGWRRRPPIATVELRSFDADDPAAAEALAALALLPEIRSVSLSGPAFGDASLLALDRLPQLEGLSLVCTLTTPEGLAKIRAPERIEYLFVEGHGFVDVVSGVGALPGLRKVDVVDVLITPNDVAALVSIPELEELRLSNILIVDKETMLTPLAGAKKLRILDVELANSEPHDVDELRAIASLPNLERLRIDVREADLPLFVGAKKLRYLAPYLRIGEEAARAFSVAHPTCVIRVRGPAQPGLYLLNGEPAPRPASEPAY